MPLFLRRVVGLGRAATYCTATGMVADCGGIPPRGIMFLVNPLLVAQRRGPLRMIEDLRMITARDHYEFKMSVFKLADEVNHFKSTERDDVPTANRPFHIFFVDSI